MGKIPRPGRTKTQTRQIGIVGEVMKIERLKQIAFAEGIVERFVEDRAGSAEPDEVSQMEKISMAWQIVSTGLKELRQENLNLALKMAEASDLLTKAINT